MDLYHVVLFIHVTAAIALVGGAGFEHVIVHMAKRSKTVDQLRSWIGLLAAVSAALNKIAPVVLLAGIYMAFAGDWWSHGWVVVSLVLFLLAGLIAGTVLEPGAKKAVAYLADLPDGPVTPEIGMAIADPKVALFANLLTGADLAIIFLMTNKPGYGGALTAAGVGLVLGYAWTLRERRHAVAAAAGPAAA